MQTNHKAKFRIEVTNNEVAARILLALAANKEKYRLEEIAPRSQYHPISLTQTIREGYAVPINMRLFECFRLLKSVLKQVYRDAGFLSQRGDFMERLGIIKVEVLVFEKLEGKWPRSMHLNKGRVLSNFPHCSISSMESYWGCVVEKEACFWQYAGTHRATEHRCIRVEAEIEPDFTNRDPEVRELEGFLQDPTKIDEAFKFFEHFT